MFKISLAQGYSVATMLVVAAVAIVLTAAFYRRMLGTLGLWRWQALLLLRLAAVVVVVLLLFRPVFSYYKNLKERPSLVFLLDSSASMSIADDASGATRFNRARGQIEKWWQKLQGGFDLHLVEFADRGRPLSGVNDLPALQPTGKATSLCRALEAASAQTGKTKTEAVIMLSDGIHNSVGNPVEIAGKLGLVVHTVGVGASLRDNVSYCDIQVTGINCPDRLLINNMARITGSVEGIGLAGRVVKALLEEDGRQVAETELTLNPANGPQQVQLDFRPTVKGRHTYTLRVPPVPEEKIIENNQRSAATLVVEPGIHVLYLEGTLRAEYGALVDRFLAKDPDLEFCALVQTRPNVFLKRSNMEGLKLTAIPNDQETIDKFDVFIIGDLDSSYIRHEQQEMLIKRIRAGAGLVMLGGYHSLGPGGYQGTPLGQALPVQLGNKDIGQLTDAFLPLLTPEGARHPIFANINGFFPTSQGEAKMAGLPRLDGCTRVEGPRPGASVLATIPGGAGAMPVLAVEPLDRGRTAVFCCDTTRNWQQGPRAMNQDSPFLRFWGQMVRWLAGRASEVGAGASVSVSTDKAEYDPQEPIRIDVVARGQEGQGAAGAKVTAKIRGPDGRPQQIALSPLPGPAGHYAGTFDPQETGPYDIIVEAQVGELTLAADKLTVAVGRANLEFEKLDLDEKMLSQIASAAGGRYFHITTADQLIDQLDRSQRKNSIYVERQLYWPPLCWPLLVGVLTLEWFLRKRFQLR